jgi:hypothetical protein
MENKTVVGLTEPVKIGTVKFIARIDTGAERSSICKTLIEKAFPDKSPKILKRVVFRTSTGTQKRPIVKIPIEIQGRKINATFSVTDRRTMSYDMLIGQNILKKNFIIDPRR